MNSLRRMVDEADARPGGLTADERHRIGKTIELDVERALAETDSKPRDIELKR